MKTEFTEDEMLIQAIYEADSRQESIKLIQEALPELMRDPDMTELMLDTADKLELISDDEYLELDLSDYHQEIEELADYEDEDEYQYLSDMDEEPTVSLDGINWRDEDA